MARTEQAITKKKLYGGKTPQDSRRNIVKEKGKHVERNKRRFRPGTVALREIRRYQQSTNLIFTKVTLSALGERGYGKIFY